MLKEELSPTAFFKKKTSMDKRFYLALKLNFYIDASSFWISPSIHALCLPFLFPPCPAIHLPSNFAVQYLYSSYLFTYFFTVSCISIRVNMNTTSPVNQRRSWLSELYWTFRLLLLSLCILISLPGVSKEGQRLCPLGMKIHITNFLSSNGPAVWLTSYTCMSDREMVCGV